MTTRAAPAAFAATSTKKESMGAHFHRIGGAQFIGNTFPLDGITGTMPGLTSA